MSTSEQPAIDLRNVSKVYRIPHERHTSLVERALSIFRPVTVEKMLALDGVTLSVPNGAFVGIVGANGSGKSTLLKIITGLMVPDSGTVKVRGTVAPLLELGLGFHAELTARENVAMYGAILGYPRREMRERIEMVIDFAELERFGDAKLKSFSSGMVARLALATALQADARILLLDEVLAVGDARFQQKCFDAFANLRQTRTILLVSHDVGAIQRFCDHVYWLDQGKIVMEGEAQHVVMTYVDVMRQDALRKASERKPGKGGAEPIRRFGDQSARFVAGILEDEHGRPLSIVRSGSRVVLHLTLEFDVDATEPVVGFGIRQLGSLGSHIVYNTNNDLLEVSLGRFAPGDRVDIRLPFTAALMNGHYTVFVAAAKRETLAHDPAFYDWINEFVTFSIEGSRCWEGLADLDAEFEFQRTATRPGPLRAAASVRSRDS